MYFGFFTNNGLLITIAKQESQVRIEVGYGLEGALPDGYLGRLEQDVLVPNFKSGNYYVGLDLAVDNLYTRITKEYKSKKPFTAKDMITDYWVYLLLAIVIIILIATGHINTALYIIMLILTRGRGGNGRNDRDIGGGGGFGGGGANRRW